MAILDEAWIYVFWDALSGTSTARPVTRWRSGSYNPLYDPLVAADPPEEPDSRPTDGAEYDSATEGWTVVPDFPEEAPPDWDTVTPLQVADYTIDTTTGVVTPVVANAPLERRKREVLRVLLQRRQRQRDNADLTARTSVASWLAARQLIANVDDVETAFAATWDTTPEALLTDPAMVEPTPTLESTPVAERIAGLMGDQTLVRGKLTPRATYDFAQAIGLGGYDSLTTLTPVANVDVGSIARGNIWALSANFEARNLSGQTTTVRLQFRYSFFGGVMSGWTDLFTWTGANFTTSYTDKAYCEFWPFPGDDIEFRIAYQCSSNLISNVLRNVYLTAVRLTVWE